MTDIVEMRAGRVARLRSKKAELKKRQAELLKLLEADPNYDELVVVNLQLGEMAKEIPSAEMALRETALSHAKLTGQTKTPIFTIKNYTVVRYTEKDAVKWCTEHFPEALTVDARRFEQVAEVMKPDFVEVTTEPRASLSSDLSAYVDMPEEVIEEVDIPF